MLRDAFDLRRKCFKTTQRHSVFLTLHSSWYIVKIMNQISTLLISRRLWALWCSADPIYFSKILNSKFEENSLKKRPGFIQGEQQVCFSPVHHHGSFLVQLLLSPLEYWLGLVNHQRSQCFSLNTWQTCGPFFFFPLSFLGWVLALRSSEPPGVPHHENKVGVAVDGGADAAVVVDKLVLGHLWIGRRWIISRDHFRERKMTTKGLNLEFTYEGGVEKMENIHDTAASFHPNQWQELFFLLNANRSIYIWDH